MIQEACCNPINNITDMNQQVNTFPAVIVPSACSTNDEWNDLALKNYVRVTMPYY
jgi:hypothetical protein